MKKQAFILLPLLLSSFIGVVGIKPASGAAADVNIYFSKIIINNDHDDDSEAEQEIELELQCKERYWGYKNWKWQWIYFWGVHQNSKDFRIDNVDTKQTFYSTSKDNDDNTLKAQSLESSFNCYDDPNYSDVRFRMVEVDVDNGDDVLVNWYYLELPFSNGHYSKTDPSGEYMRAYVTTS